jgi:hypothetical protein
MTAILPVRAPHFPALARPATTGSMAATTYMIGRVALNQATESAFGEYGDLNKEGGDKALLAAAENGLRTYLKGWPNGEYAASARGLLRRVYWLGQDRQKLLNEYIAQFAEKDAGKRNISLADLVQEMDIKLFGELGPDDTSDPELLAVIALREMRYYDEDDRQNASRMADQPRVDRGVARAFCKGKDDLFNYLLAAHAYYVEKNPAPMLKLIPAGTTGGGYLGYSRQLLRAVAMDGVGDAGRAGGADCGAQCRKLPFQKGTAELGLALHLERLRRSIWSMHRVPRSATVTFAKSCCAIRPARRCCARALSDRSAATERRRDRAICVALQATDAWRLCGFCEGQRAGSCRCEAHCRG